MPISVTNKQQNQLPSQLINLSLHAVMVTVRDNPNLPVVVTFAPGSRLLRESPYTPALPILRNGPPGTFVRFNDGTLVPLPTDQIVFGCERENAAEVTFGGMMFAGIEDGQLVFHGVKEMLALDILSPQRGIRMTLNPSMVTTIQAGERFVWPQS
jgi:hypothetical protein